MGRQYLERAEAKAIAYKEGPTYTTAEILNDPNWNPQWAVAHAVRQAKSMERQVDVLPVLLADVIYWDTDGGISHGR